MTAAAIACWNHAGWREKIEANVTRTTTARHVETTATWPLAGESVIGVMIVTLGARPITARRAIAEQ